MFEQIVDDGRCAAASATPGTMSLFDLCSAVDDAAPRVRRPAPPIPDVEFAKSERLAFEKEMLGLYVSDHPLHGRRARAAALRRLHARRARASSREGEMRTVGGVVTALARKYTKRGDLMATFVLEDLGAAIEVMVFPKTMAQLRRPARRRRDRRA